MAEIKEKTSIFSSLGLVVVLLAIIASGWMLGGQIEELEDRLSYDPPVADPSVDLTSLVQEKSGKIYLPIYSHIFSDNKKPVLLESLVSLRNTDPNHPLVIHTVDYYDSAGEQIDSLLTQPVRLDPMASAELVIDTSDKRGGTGANLLIHWSAEAKVNRPLFEAVMSSVDPDHSFAFTSRGIELWEAR